MMKRFLTVLTAMILLSALSLCSGAAQEEINILVEDGVAITESLIVEYGYDYCSDEEVALYLHVFRELPPNFLTKDEAYELGWISSKGNLWEVAWGLSIGGDRFGNREGLLPDEYDRCWYEADVNYEGGYRSGERIVFSNDGLIYVTFDHYGSFDLLYEGWYADELSLYRYPADTYTAFLYDDNYLDPYWEIYGH